MMDYVDIISAGLSALVTLIVCLVNNYYQMSKTNALIGYRLSELEKKVDKHNNLVERMYNVETVTSRIQDEVNRHKERLRDAEKALKDMEGDLK